MSHMASRVRRAVLPIPEPKVQKVDRQSVQLILFLMTFIAYGYFFGGTFYVQNARYDVIHSFVEPGFHEFRTFSIDRFIATGHKDRLNTESWAKFDGHYYSTEAPGSALLGILAYEPLYHLEVSQRIQPSTLQWSVVNAYLINLFVTVFFAALGAVYFFRLLCREGLPEKTGAALSLVFAFATLSFPYSTQLWGHVTALSFLVIALFYLLEESSDRSLALSGFSAGAAIAVDYFSLVAVAVFFLTGLVRHRVKIVFFLIGLAFPLGCLGLYYNRCFGSPWMWAPNADRVDQMIVRFSMPAVDRFADLLIGGFRGLFIHMPILLLTPFGFVQWFRRKTQDPLLWVCFFSVIAFLAVNSSMIDWHGGRTVAARYQIVAILFWVLPLKELKYDGTMLCIFITLAFVSVVNMVAISAVSPLCIAGLQSPYYGCVLPRFFAGEFHPYVFPPRMFTVEDLKNTPQILTAWNLGMFMGFKGLLSLVPLFIVEIVLAGALILRLAAERVGARK